MQVSFDAIFSGASEPCLSVGSVLSPKQCETCSLEEFNAITVGTPLAPVDPPTVSTPPPMTVDVGEGPAEAPMLDSQVCNDSTDLKESRTYTCATMTIFTSTFWQETSLTDVPTYKMCAGTHNSCGGRRGSQPQPPGETTRTGDH